jgi:hypothetical protein
MRKISLLAALPLALTTAALAQNAGPTQQKDQSRPNAAQQKGGQNSGQSAEAIQERVRQNLQQAGFTDIKLMPSSFLVRAKDQAGNPVLMVINPDSVTAVTEVPQQDHTVGSGTPQHGDTGVEGAIKK